MIPNIIIKGVITILQKQFKLDKLMSYVFEQNELDDRCDSLEERVGNLECDTHPPRDFVVCDKCKQKIKEK